ncbi:MAG: asparagine synthase (glutamine-hydrolyzing) [Xanthomonadales bacterium]|nr:asparagine synthase (glutamine-hydrolyzing) [Xanthomonadales bacterium]
MCGITGHWAYSGPHLQESVFRQFNNSLAHRGPNGAGVEYFQRDGLWLGHRRLSIIDVSSQGHQPMSYADARYWLSYNGEIYNFLELREQLRQRGHRFVSDSDSEVILAAYAEWGADCQQRFNGMWAFAIWDTHARQLFLSRDRFGIKPLYYAEHQGGFAFASELKAFRTLPWCDGALDQRVLSATLHSIVGQEARDETLLSGVKRLAAGHCMTLTGNDRRVTRWWETGNHLPELPSDLQGQTDAFRTVFMDACRLRMRSDVPIATSLSGGLDSSAVACAISALARGNELERIPQDWQQAFIACFPGTGLQEQHYAEQIVEHTGLHAHYLNIDVNTAVDNIERVVFDLEDLWFVPMVGAWALYREMRQAGVRVSLDGHGADELLGGYHFFVQAAIEAQYGPAFRLGRLLDLNRVRAGLAGGTQVGGSGALLSRTHWWDDLKSLARSVLPESGLPFRRNQPDQSAMALRTALLRPIDDTQYGLPLAAGHAPGTPLNQMLYQYFHQRVLPTFLRCIDRASMAHGVEVRMPFLDWRLVTLGFSLPDESKIGGGYTKRILRLAMEGLMPDPVRLRTQKIHFSSPVDDWSRQGLGPWLQDIASSQSFRESALWDGRAAETIVTKAVAGQAAIDPVWPLINAHVLERAFRTKGANIATRGKQHEH